MCIDSISGWSLPASLGRALSVSPTHIAFLLLLLPWTPFFYATHCMELPTNEAHLQGLNWSTVSHFQPPPPCNNALALILAEAHKHSEALWGCLSRAALEPWKPSKTKENDHFFLCMLPPIARSQSLSALGIFLELMYVKVREEQLCNGGYYYGMFV